MRFRSIMFFLALNYVLGACGTEFPKHENPDPKWQYVDYSENATDFTPGDRRLIVFSSTETNEVLGCLWLTANERGNMRIQEIPAEGKKLKARRIAWYPEENVERMSQQKLVSLVKSKAGIKCGKWSANGFPSFEVNGFNSNERLLVIFTDSKNERVLGGIWLSANSDGVMAVNETPTETSSLNNVRVEQIQEASVEELEKRVLVALVRSKAGIRNRTAMSHEKH